MRAAIMTSADDGQPLVVGLGDQAATWTMEEFVSLQADLDLVVNFMANEPLLVADVAGQRTTAAIRRAQQTVVGLDHADPGLVDVLINLYAFLSVTRAFVDQSDRELKHLFGEGSPERTAFAAALRAVYDGSECYRFLYGLRNYAQHRAVPLNQHQAATAQLVDVGGAAERVETLFDVCCDRDALLADTSWKPAVRDWISEQPAFFAVAPVIERGLNDLRSIAVEFYAVRAASVLAAHGRLSLFWELFQRDPAGAAAPMDGLPGYSFIDRDHAGVARLAEFNEVPHGRYGQMVEAARQLLNPPDGAQVLIVCYPQRGRRWVFG